MRDRRDINAGSVITGDLPTPERSLEHGEMPCVNGLIRRGRSGQGNANGPGFSP